MEHTSLTRALAPLRDDARIEHFRQLGMIWAFDVREPLVGARFAERFQVAGRKNGLLIRPIGRTVYLLPPYVLDDALSEWLAERLMSTLDAVTPRASDPHADRASEPAIA